MAKRISKNFIRELVADADIVDVVSRFVPLKKSGKNHKGCCPFHNEKTPSFFVMPDKNFFYCFGCQATGDVLTFVKKINNLEFSDAVKTLADLSGKTVEYENHSEEDIEKEQLYNKCISFLDIAQKYYRWNLGNSTSKTKAIEYLKKRAVNSELAKIYGIGYSSDGWSNIIQLAKSTKVSEKVLVESGLVVKKDNGNIYDRFRGRIMFPIRNIQGSVIAYGGRVIDDNDGVKYINSPETLVFHKNNTLYGLYEYRQMKRQKEIGNSLVVVEGYMDVVGLASLGFYGAVATLGTAFSQNHAKILFRETNSVVLCFDGDRAGQNAAIRTIKIVLPILDANKKLRVLTLTDAKDPDEYVKKYGLEKFQQALDEALVVSDYLIQRFISNKDLSRAESKAEILESLKNFVADVDDNIYSESLISAISEKIGIKVEQIKKLLAKRSNPRNLTKVAEQLPQRKLAKNITIEEILLAEIFANPEDFLELQENNNIEIFAATEDLQILREVLKILKEEQFSSQTAVTIIQLLTESYPNYRDYFFELLSYGISKTLKEHAGDDYQKLVLEMLARVEDQSRRKQLKYLTALPFRSEIQKQELKYLLVKLGR